MQKLEVIISQHGRSLGHAIGETAEGRKIVIQNGDLLKSGKAVVYITGEKGDYLIGEIQETYAALESVVDLIDKDNLLPSRFISIVDRGVFSIKGKLLFPRPEIMGVLDYVVNESEFWAISRWAVTATRGVRAAAMLFGVTFKSAIEKLRNSNISKARLYCPNPERFSDRGMTAEMLAIVNNDDEGNVVLQIWQGVGDRTETFYAHAIVSKASGACSHFDTALIGFGIAEKDLLFGENRKIKSGKYTKLFRMDGAFSMDVVYDIANRFFPLSELIDEYFEVEPLSSI